MKNISSSIHPAPEHFYSTQRLFIIELKAIRLSFCFYQAVVANSLKHNLLVLHFLEKKRNCLEDGWRFQVREFTQCAKGIGYIGGIHKEKRPMIKSRQKCMRFFFWLVGLCWYVGWMRVDCRRLGNYWNITSPNSQFVASAQIFSFDQSSQAHSWRLNATDKIKPILIGFLASSYVKSSLWYCEI